MYAYIGQILNLRNSMGIHRITLVENLASVFLIIEIPINSHQLVWDEAPNTLPQNFTGWESGWQSTEQCPPKHRLRFYLALLSIVACLMEWANAFGLWSSMNQCDPVWEAQGCLSFLEKHSPLPTSKFLPVSWMGLLPASSFSLWAYLMFMETLFANRTPKK